MNVVYLHAHDAGRYIEPYGYGIPTPHLMQLAREGTLFRHAYCAGPTCSPSRAAMLTGMSPHESGMIGLCHRGFSLNEPKQHLAAYLRSQGYETVLSGVQHEFRHNQHDQFYDQSLPVTGDGVSGEWDLNAALGAARFLRERPQDAEKPFFLACGFVLPHRKFPDPDPDINPDYLQPPRPLPDNARARWDMATYMTAARRMDTAAGVVLNALRETGRDKDTLVIFTVDHGIAFPWMKCNLYDTGMGVSLILKYPGNGTVGKALDGLVSHLDVFPTVCDLTGVAAPEWLTGCSLRPMLEGTAETVREEVFSEVTYHAGYEPQRAIRTERYKYIEIIDEDLTPVSVNCDASASKDIVLEAGWLDHARQPVQLYDLDLDPGERHNLAEHRDYTAVRKELSARLRNWMERTGDPLLNGPVAAPKGAKVNLRSQLEPDEPPQVVD